MEVFTGIGMSKAVRLTQKMLVLADEAQVLCIYLYRDSSATKIALQTRNIMIVGYGAPEISEQQLIEAVETTLLSISSVAGGQIQTLEVFSSTS